MPIASRNYECLASCSFQIKNDIMRNRITHLFTSIQFIVCRCNLFFYVRIKLQQLDIDTSDPNEFRIGLLRRKENFFRDRGSGLGAMWIRSREMESASRKATLRRTGLQTAAWPSHRCPSSIGGDGMTRACRIRDTDAPRNARAEERL